MSGTFQDIARLELSGSKIQWTEKTINPVTGCSKVSPGCKNCYAETQAARLQMIGNPRYASGFDVTLHEDLVAAPEAARKPTLYFCNSMSDLFHEDVPDEFIWRCFDMMSRCPHHRFQVLTKRGERLAELGPRLPRPESAWMGVSVESDQAYNKRGERPTDRIEQLRRSGFGNLWISAEPLLGPLPELNLEGISWVVVGGESGKGAREMNPEWAADIAEQCRKAGVPVFVKQLGAVWGRANKGGSKGQNVEAWPAELQVREIPRAFEPFFDG